MFFLDLRVFPLFILDSAGKAERWGVSVKGSLRQLGMCERERSKSERFIVMQRKMMITMLMHAAHVSHPMVCHVSFVPKRKVWGTKLREDYPLTHTFISSRPSMMKILFGNEIRSLEICAKVWVETTRKRDT